MSYSNDCPSCGTTIETKEFYVIVVCPGCREKLYVDGDEKYKEETDDWPFETRLVSYDPAVHGDAKEVPPT